MLWIPLETRVPSIAAVLLVGRCGCADLNHLITLFHISCSLTNFSGLPLISLQTCGALHVHTALERPSRRQDSIGPLHEAVSGGSPLRPRQSRRRVRPHTPLGHSKCPSDCTNISWISQVGDRTAPLVHQVFIFSKRCRLQEALSPLHGSTDCPVFGGRWDAVHSARCEPPVHNLVGVTHFAMI